MNNEWFDSYNLRFILRVAKKSHGSIVIVNMVDNETYTFEFNHDDRMWKIEHIFNNGNDYLLDFKRRPNNYCKRMEGVIKISIVNTQDQLIL